MTIDTKRLRELADKATPGPWEADGNEVSQHWSRPEPWKTVASSEVACMSYCYGGSGRGIENEADAEFIAATDPQTIIGLLDEIERYRDTLFRILGYTRGAVRRLMPEELAELERERRSDD